MATDILNPIASGLSTLANFSSDLITNKANQVENQKSRDYNTQMWQMQNVYNSPAQQMRRLSSAGLNPNLAYGGGATVTGNASAPPPSSPVHYNAPHVDFGEVLQALMSKAQIANMNQQNELLRWQTGAAKEKYINDHMTNKLLFGQDFSVSNKAAGSSLFGWVEDEKSGTYGYKTKNAITKQAMLEAALQGQNLTNIGSGLTNRIKSQEAELSEYLKPRGLTATDPWYVRAGLKGAKWITEGSNAKDIVWWLLNSGLR